MNPKKILNANEISTILNRLSFQLIEDHNTFDNTVIVAIQPRGAILGKRIYKLINKHEKNNNLKIGFKFTFKSSKKPITNTPDANTK